MARKENSASIKSMGVEDSAISQNYHDYAGVYVDEKSSYSNFPVSSSDEKGNNSCQDSFPVRLHYVLSQIEQDGLSNIVSWQPHGRCFVVRDRKTFVDIVLQQWFRQSKYTSFQRQLNLYGFKRLTAGRDRGGYYHELFLRGNPNLASLIQRTLVKGTKTRKVASPQTEPDFYKMKYIPSTTDSDLNSKSMQSAVYSSPDVVPRHSILAGTTLPISSSFQDLPGEFILSGVDPSLAYPYQNDDKNRAMLTSQYPSNTLTNTYFPSYAGEQWASDRYVALPSSLLTLPSSLLFGQINTMIRDYAK